MSDIGDRIRAARRGSDYPTQEALAARLGVDRVAISNWENNKDLPTMGNFIALAKATGHSLDWLCGLVEFELDGEAAQVLRRWNTIPENARAAVKSTIAAFVTTSPPKAS